MTKIQNVHLQLASIQQSYKDQYYEIYLENKNYHKFGYSEPKSRDKFEERFENSEVDPCFVLVNDSDVVLGFCGVETFRSVAWAEINYVIKKKFQNKGLGKTMLNLVISELKQTGFVDYIEAVTIQNPNSDRLLESLGFQKASFYPEYRKIIIDGKYTKLNQTGFFLKIK